MAKIFKKLYIAKPAVSVGANNTRWFHKLSTFVINGTYLFNNTITELPIVYAEGADLYEQTAVRISFDDGTGAFVGKTMFTEQIEDGYGKVLRCGPTLRPQYYFDTNLWDMEKYQCVSFDNVTARNLKGEDVTQIFNEWLTANTIKQGQITFAVDGITYTADEGMCWMQWIRSDYDKGGITTSLIDCVKKGDYYVTAEGNRVSRADVIIAGYNYILSQ